MRSFRDRVAAITGAGSGIGRALALQFARQGCHLALSDIDAEGLAHTADRVASGPTTTTTSVVDVADRAAVDAWAAEVAEEHGRVNVIINNAGVAMAGSVEHLSIEDYEWLLGINFWGVVYGTKAFLPHLREADEGHIVNISSIFGLFSQPSQSAYNASKFAVRGFTESLRQELDIDGGSVSATCVHPGGIATNIARAARMDRSTGVLLDTDPDVARDKFDRMLRTSADDAATAILKGVRRDARRVLIGSDARAADKLQRFLPTGYQMLIGRGARLLS